jgi:signal transduction histidine kinase
MAYSELKAAQNDSLRNERLSTIGKFSSLILHDIRNPLSVMKALAELIDDSAEKPVDVHSGMVRMRSEIFRMERLAAEFLDYSRGEIRLSLGVCTVQNLFQQVAEGMGNKFQKSGIVLVLEDKVRGAIVVDGDRFVRVLLNLLDNARKAMPTGGEAHVLAERDGDELIFTVSDTGEGMSKEVQARVFEPFFSNSGKGGTGLGMLIVKNIVEAHEGSVELFSELGSGTRIRISIPAKV